MTTFCGRAPCRLKHQVTALRQASLGVRARPVPDGTGEDTGAAPEPSSQPVLLLSNDGSVSVAQVARSAGMRHIYTFWPDSSACNYHHSHVTCI